MSLQAVTSQGVGQPGNGRGMSPLANTQIVPSRPKASPSSASFHAPAPEEVSSSDSGVVSRVLAGIDSIGAVPAEVSVYTQPVGRSIVTDVVVHQTDQKDGEKTIGNHWQGNPIPAPETAHSDGIGASGLRVGAYEESRMAAHEAYMMFQGMKLNQIA